MPRILFAMLAVFLGFALVAQAQAPGFYSGTTEQGMQISLSVEETPTGPVIASWQVSFSLSCLASGEQIGSGVGFGGFLVPIGDGKFEFKYQALTFYFQFSGTFTGYAEIVGDARMEIGALVYRKRARLSQKCSSGEVAWQADFAPPPPPSPPKGTPTAQQADLDHDVAIEVRGPDGAVTVRTK